MGVAAQRLVARAAAYDDAVWHARFGRRFVEVDAHALERGHWRKSSVARPGLLCRVGLVDPDVDRDRVMARRRTELARAGEHLRPQPPRDRIVGKHVDVDLVARGLPERPPVGDLDAVVVADQPRVVVRVEAGFVEFVGNFGQGDVGGSDERCVVAVDHREHRLGIVWSGPTPPEADR